MATISRESQLKGFAAMMAAKGIEPDGTDAQSLFGLMGVDTDEDKSAVRGYIVDSQKAARDAAEKEEERTWREAFEAKLAKAWSKATERLGDVREGFEVTAPSLKKIGQRAASAGTGGNGNGRKARYLVVSKDGVTHGPAASNTVYSAGFPGLAKEGTDVIIAKFVKAGWEVRETDKDGNPLIHAATDTAPDTATDTATDAAPDTATDAAPDTATDAETDGRAAA